MTFGQPLVAHQLRLVRDNGVVKKPGVEEIRGAWEALAADPVEVAETLVNLAVNAQSETIRMRAAQAVLDRVGLHARRDIGIDARTFTTPANTGAPARPAVDIVIERLAQVRASRDSAGITCDS